MFRPINSTCVHDELCMMLQLNQAMGVPDLEGYFHYIERSGWVTRNPEIYHLYEEDGVLRGYAGLFPLYPQNYRSFLESYRFPYFDLQPEDLLTSEEYARARREGVWIFVESFVAPDARMRRLLGEYVYQFLSEIHLKGYLTHTSDPQSEADCRWLGLQFVKEVGPSLTGVRKLWHADESVVAPTADQPFGPPTPVRCLFLAVQQRFQASIQGLHLSPAERQVARLFYLEERKADDIARRLEIQPGTVKTYLQRIRRKAEPVVGSRLSRRIAAYLLQHPGEVGNTER